MCIRDSSTDVSTRLPELHAYTILSILNNLTANAIEAIHERGSIAISMKRMGSDLHLEVTNTGSSIPLRRLRQIFRPGYTTKYDSDGRASSGVGLTYVKSLAEHLGGSITAASDGKDNVTFHIALPLNSLMTHPIANLPAVEKAGAASSQQKGPLS